LNFFRYIFGLFFFAGCSGSFAQSYFQQEVNYKINASLDDKKHTISAKETIEYVNNSPDTLNFIWFHLWPNAYKNGETALANQKLMFGDNSLQTAVQSDLGYIDSLDFTINGEHLKWESDQKHIDICRVFLNKPLLPGEKTYIQTPFFVKIPSSQFSRLGHYEQSYQITQWYPKPAVYDRDGWHPMPYLDLGEFYSEYGSFDVTLTLPENYVVGATGELYTENEKIFLDKKAAETAKIMQFDTTALSFPNSSSKLKTIRYTEKHIHDFAWFADKRYHVLKSHVTLPGSKRKVTTYVMFTNEEAGLWKKASEYINDAVYYYSLWIGDYPYNYCTAIQSTEGMGGGMEYPNITLIGSAGSDKSLEEVIMHEVGHNWWYGILGSNERDFPWIDEGLNTFYELRYMKTKYPDYSGTEYLGLTPKVAEFFLIKNLPYQGFYDFACNITARNNQDQPLNLTSEKYTGTNYFTGIYLKTAFNFYYLMSYLGEKEFDNIIQAFYKEWKFKHPGPEDIQHIFNKMAPGKSDWLFNNLIKTTRRLDYKISGLKKNKNGEIVLKLKNTGDVASPLNITLLKNDSVKDTIWFEGFQGKKKLSLPQEDFDLVRIDHLYAMPELNRKNNTIRKNGLFRKMEPLHFQLLTSIESHNYTQFYYFPVIAYNYYDKFMPGLAIYNLSIQQKQFEYMLLPLYSFENSDLSGTGQFQFTFFPFRNLIQSANVNLSGSKFGLPRENHFDKMKAEFTLELIDNKQPVPVGNKIILSAISATNPIDLAYFGKNNLSNYYSVKFSHQNKRKFDPFGYMLTVELNEDFAKTFTEIKYSKTYKNKKKSFDLRLFGGCFIHSSEEAHFGNFRLSGWKGIEDYQYEGVFPGRHEVSYKDGHNHLLSQQFMTADGGFAVGSPIGNTDRWLISGNFSAGLPFALPLKIYGSFGIFSQDMYDATNKREYVETMTAAELGVEFVLIRKFCSVYFPVVLSKDIDNYFETNGYYYWQKIRFTLNLAGINPVKLVKEIEF